MKNTIMQVLLVLLLVSQISCVPIKIDGHPPRFTGQTLIDIGQKLDKPVLKLVGKTLRDIKNEMNKTISNLTGTSLINLEDVVQEMCNLHPCADWTEWSKCDAIKSGEFGGQTRSRTCGLHTTLCERYGVPNVESDTRLCEGVCPNDYVFTKHGFCLKIYDNDKKQRDDAESVCRNDGGHLVNIDSFTKVHDVNETLIGQSYSGTRLWIDGRRTVQAGQFKYGYKSENASFTFWGDNDPDSGVKDLCVMYYKDISTEHLWRWFDTGCSYKYEFICEIQ